MSVGLAEPMKVAPKKLLAPGGLFQITMSTPTLLSFTRTQSPPREPGPAVGQGNVAGVVEDEGARGNGDSRVLADHEKRAGRHDCGRGDGEGLGDPDEAGIDGTVLDAPSPQVDRAHSRIPNLEGVVVAGIELVDEDLCRSESDDEKRETDGECGTTHGELAGGGGRTEDDVDSK